MYSLLIGDSKHTRPMFLYEFFLAKGTDYGIIVVDALMAIKPPIVSRFI